MASPALTSRTADLALLAMAAAWGSSYLATKTIATNENSFGFLSLRFLIATAALTVAMAPRLRGLRRDEVLFGAAFGCILAIIFSLETFGVVHTTASNAGLIISLTILVTPVLSTAVGGDDPDRKSTRLNSSHIQKSRMPSSA